MVVWESTLVRGSVLQKVGAGPLIRTFESRCKEEGRKRKSFGL
jgi:hypothetical protein